MHYGSKDFSKFPFVLTTVEPKQPGAKIGQRRHLSQQDTIQLNLFYCRWYWGSTVRCLDWSRNKMRVKLQHCLIFHQLSKYMRQSMVQYSWRSQRSHELLRRCVHRTQVDEKCAYKNSEIRTSEIEKRMAHFKNTCTTIERFREILKCCYSRAFRPRSFASCEVRDVLRPNPALCVRCTYASLPWFCVQQYYMQNLR